MRGWLRTACAAFATMFVASTAVAGPGYHHSASWQTTPASLRIDNDSASTVRVYVDRQFRGAISANDDRTFSALPGPHSVRVVDWRGEVLLNEQMNLSTRRTAQRNVGYIPAFLALRNHGDALLQVTVNHQDQWISPGEVARFEVRRGTARVYAVAHTRRGIREVVDQTYDVWRGRTRTADIGWFAPTRTSDLSLVNTWDRPVRVSIDGRMVARLAPGETSWVTVSTGTRDVVISRHHETLYRGSYRIGRGESPELRIGRRGLVAWNDDAGCSPQQAPYYQGRPDRGSWDDDPRQRQAQQRPGRDWDDRRQTRQDDLAIAQRDERPRGGKGTW